MLSRGLQILGWVAAAIVLAPGVVPTQVAKDPAPPDPFCFIFPDGGLAVPCQVVRVIDGDTVEIEARVKASVRLLDCWAPELNTKEGKLAKAHLVAEAEGKEGALWVPFKGDRLGSVFSFGRVLGHVRVAGELQTLSEKQVAAGYATTER